MPRSVKTRAYDSSRRRSASVQRRHRILAAARELFIARGYAGTTMAAVAERAEVATDTVYELAGRKPELFRLLLETAISGRDEVVAAEDRDYVKQIHREPSAAGKLAIYAHALPELHARLAPLITVLQAAAPTDRALADLWHELSERRAGNMVRLARELADTGRLAVPTEEAADVVWATSSPEMYLLLVRRRGWSHDRYERWLVDSWQRLLIDG